MDGGESEEMAKVNFEQQTATPLSCRSPMHKHRRGDHKLGVLFNPMTAM
jgi:hypothetical protein